MAQHFTRCHERYFSLGHFVGLLVFISVIVNKLNVMYFTILPRKAKPVLVVDTDTPLALAATLERFQPICRRDVEVVQARYRVKLEQLSSSVKPVNGTDHMSAARTPGSNAAGGRAWRRQPTAESSPLPSKSLAERRLFDRQFEFRGYKCPRGVTMRDEPLPLTGPGKIRKNALRTALASTRFARL